MREFTKMIPASHVKWDVDTTKIRSSINYTYLRTTSRAVVVSVMQIGKFFMPN